MGSRIAAGFAAVVAGVMVADILIHPAGTAAAGNAAAALWKPLGNSLLGYKN